MRKINEHNMKIEIKSTVLTKGDIRIQVCQLAGHNNKPVPLTTVILEDKCSSQWERVLNLLVKSPIPVTLAEHLREYDTRPEEDQGSAIVISDLNAGAAFAAKLKKKGLL